MDLEHRSQGDAWRQAAGARAAPRRRHGRPARRAAAPCPGSPRWSARTSNGPAATCSTPSNSKKNCPGKDPAFATDEPADIEGVNATTVLVRRVKQERRGMVPAPAQRKDLERTQSSTPSTGGTSAHPPTATWPSGSRTDSLSQGRPGPHQIPAHPRPLPRPGHRADLHLAHRGQAGLPGHRRPAQRRPSTAYPPLNLATGWTAQNVRVILANPKYTGYMVYGRHRTRNGRRPPAPKTMAADAAAPVHPAIVDRNTLGPGPDHRRRARNQPRRRRPEPAPGHRPVLPVPVPHPVPGLPAADDRHHLRQAGLPVHLLPVPAQLGQPQARRRPPRPPPHRPGRRNPPRPGLSVWVLADRVVRTRTRRPTRLARAPRHRRPVAAADSPKPRRPLCYKARIAPDRDRAERQDPRTRRPYPANPDDPAASGLLAPGSAPGSPSCTRNANGWKASSRPPGSRRPRPPSDTSPAGPVCHWPVDILPRLSTEAQGPAVLRSFLNLPCCGTSPARQATVHRRDHRSPPCKPSTAIPRPRTGRLPRHRK